MRLVSLILFVVIANLARAQQYIHMLTDGKEWQCMEEISYSYFTDGVFPFTYMVMGDTIVDGNSYKKIVHQYTDSVPANRKHKTTFLAFERDAKVYLFNSEEKKNILLLDFSLQKGDVANEYMETVEDIDTIYCYGQYRRRMRIGNATDKYWVEGIGPNSESAFAPKAVASYVDNSYVLYCYDNGKLIFDKQCFASPTAAINGIRIDSDNKGKTYDTSGRITTGETRGIYIRCGRKFVKR